MTRRTDNLSLLEIAQAYTSWRLPLLRFIQRQLGNRDQAEDLVQESFARLAASPSQPPPDKQRAYLYQITQNLIHDAGREQMARGNPVSLDTLQEDDMPTDHASPLAVASQRQRLARLDEALAELPERQREAFVLYRFDGLTQDEIAERMGISRRMVVKHLGRALAYCQLRVNYASAEQMRAAHVLESSHDL